MSGIPDPSVLVDQYRSGLCTLRTPQYRHQPAAAVASRCRHQLSRYTSQRLLQLHTDQARPDHHHCRCTGPGTHLPAAVFLRPRGRSVARNPPVGCHPPAPVARGLRYAVRTDHDVLAEGRVLAAGIRHRWRGAWRSTQLCAARHDAPPVCQRPRTTATRPGEARPSGVHHHHRLVFRPPVHSDRPVARLRTVCSLCHPRHHAVLTDLPAASIKARPAYVPCFY